MLHLPLRWHRKKDGTRFSVEVTMRYFHLEGRAVCLMAVRDITARLLVEESMRMFSQQIIAAREEEKKQVSAVLHHDVGSMAVGMHTLFDTVEMNIRTQRPGEALRSMRRVRKLFNQSLDDLKQVAVGLRPPELDILGLGAAFRQHFSQITRRRGTQIRFKESLGGRRLPDAAATILFRVAQEALTNAMKHGRAKRVEVDLSAKHEKVTLVVRDNGQGFDPAEKSTRARSQTMGLQVMREMAVSVGGTLGIDSSPGGGTRVSLSIPLGTTVLGATDGGECKKPVARRRAAPGRGMPTKGGGEA
jgi:signal transduction histidine kinase